MSCMSLIHWTDEFDIGVEEVDLQHQYFTKLINRLITELTSTDDKDYESMLLEEIIYYAVFHFTSEKNMMFCYKYPDLPYHKEQHNILLEELNQKVNYFKLNKITFEGIIDFVTDWFLQHTAKVDKQFGRYFTTEGKNKSIKLKFNK